VQDNWKREDVVNYIGITLKKEALLKCLYFSRLRRTDMVGEWFGAVTCSWDVAVKAVLRVSTT